MFVQSFIGFWLKTKTFLDLKGKHELSSRKNRKYLNRMLTKAYSDGTTIFYRYMMILFSCCLPFTQNARPKCVQKKKVVKKQNNNRSFRRSWKALNTHLNNDNDNKHEFFWHSFFKCKIEEINSSMNAMKEMMHGVPICNGKDIELKLRYNSRYLKVWSKAPKIRDTGILL